MLSRIQALQEDHSRLRALLRNCEGAGVRDLAVALLRLEEVFVPHHQAKLALYDDSVLAFQAAGDKTSVSVLSIFRANTRVMSAAILGFLQSPDPDPGRFSERFSAVASTMRSMLSTEEKVVFPLCTRFAQQPRLQP
ncbi:hemerythrin domain-containing protein [Hyalangium sp.]|uniref:hemerythrin domain-containing protein n=1 Tax=Hyalangium sp. TaxID=2028555 RepID=UPI002D2AD7B4|nr:hemerythrin domain-containing protein [Hyalangium sp.]HYH99029.1 hemerythrin domain-containing protein [Hyalangium sp.]